MSAKLDLLVECLAATRIGKKGQLTLPKKYRDEMGLKAGDPIAMLRIGDGLILMPEQTRFRLLCGAISSALEGFNIT